MSGSPPHLTQYQLEHDDRATKLISVNMVPAALAAIAVILRLCSRRVVRARIMADDYLIILALVFAFGLCFGIFPATHYGLGKHAEAVGPAGLEGFAKFSFGYDLVYNFCLPTIKLSILLFYARIFPQRGFRIALWITAGYVAAWFIWNVIDGILLCNPPAKAWNPKLPGHCVNTIKAVLASAAINISADVIILCLPMYPLWHLQVSTLQKIGLTCIFLLGGFVCVASLVRLLEVTKANPEDITWTYVDGVIWSAVEPCVGIVSACLPTLRPLFRTIGERVSSRYASRNQSKGYSKGPESTHGVVYTNKPANGTVTINESQRRIARRSSDEPPPPTDGQNVHELALRNDKGKINEVTNDIAHYHTGSTEKPSQAGALDRDVEANPMPQSGIQVQKDLGWSEEYRNA